ncbi:MAG: hypothetical protein ACLQU1_35970 [Bryobacteraceae bacterium]
MTIEITRPEVEALIQQRLESGAFLDAEDVILQALRSSEPPPKKSLVQFFRESPLVGLELEFERDRDTGRDVDL